MGNPLDKIDKIAQLQQNGVTFLKPESIYIGPEVVPSRIAGEGVTIYPGCRLEGAQTLILKGAQLGGEGPVHVKNCCIGPRVALKGGYFEGAVFLEGAQMGLGAHVRSGTILEEGARGAHTVALKQTLLMPYVTLGSLINFCDCFMAGGTSASDHSEVGSSFIHFNYTPNQDKATPSLIGDVPRGVMLYERPIFLGGQGGIVGPCRVAYGTVSAAGTILRRDVEKKGQIILEGLRKSVRLAHQPGKYSNIQRIVGNNLQYIANLLALSQWYHHVRPLFLGPNLTTDLLHGLQANLRALIIERNRRLAQLSEKLKQSQPLCPAGGREFTLQGQFIQQWSRIESMLSSHVESIQLSRRGDRFLTQLLAADQFNAHDYLATLGNLPDHVKIAGTAWLQQIVDRILAGIQTKLSQYDIIGPEVQVHGKK